MPAHPPPSRTSKLRTLPEATLGPPSPSSPPPSPSAVYQPSMGSGRTVATRQERSSGVNCDHLSKAVGFPWWLGGKESTCQCRRHGFDPWIGKIPWRRKWQPTPVFLPGKFHGQRSLAGYTVHGFADSDITEQLNNSSIPGSTSHPLASANGNLFGKRVFAH